MSAWRSVFGVRHGAGLSEWLYSESVLEQESAGVRGEAFLVFGVRERMGV